MDKLKKEIKAVKDKLNHIEPVLVMCYTDVKDVGRNQEHIEHRLSINEGLEKRMTALEEYMGTLHKHVNEAIVRVNTFHQCLKVLTNEDLQCNEKIEDSNDEFNMDDTDEKIETEAKQLKRE